jgi:meiotically up-regulated gene 157 (Mug157) protein
MFRPSDDATIFPYLIPSNFFAVRVLTDLAELLKKTGAPNELIRNAGQLASQVEQALKQYAIVQEAGKKPVFAYEINGFGSFNLMDDANVPSLLSLPYLGAVSSSDAVYQNTRQLLLSADNPFFFKGKAGEGIGGPHVGMDMIWPLSIIMRGLTSTDDKEIKYCIDILQHTHAETGFMHESFHKDDPARFSRKWFAWANTIFGEFILKIYRERPGLLV